jgi:hypothetical protein
MSHQAVKRPFKRTVSGSNPLTGSKCLCIGTNEEMMHSYSHASR